MVKPGLQERPGRALRTEPVTQCPLCGGSETAPLFHAPDRMHGVPGSFCYSRCGACRTVFQNPRVAEVDLPACYPGSYYTHTPGGTAARPKQAEAETGSGRLGKLRTALSLAALGRPAPGLLGWMAHAATRIPAVRERFTFGLLDELLPTTSRPGRALDIGCGAGQLLVLLQRAGWAVEGVEWDAAAASVAREVSGRPVSVGDFQSLSLPGEAYELIVLSHVFEHLADPSAALRRLHSLLAPGGRLVLIYPNPEALGARQFGDAWYPWDPPRHLVMAPGPAVAARASSVGFRPLSCRTVSRLKWSMVNFAKSRAYRAGFDSESVVPLPEDRKRAKLAAMQCRLGLPAGDEVVLALQKLPVHTPGTRS